MRSILAFAILVASLPLHAILTRSDREDSEYLELGTRYPAAVAIAPNVDGALIAPRWILTSAKGATLLQGAKSRPPLVLGGRPNAIEATFIHPEWRQGREADIALVFLREAVQGVTPVPASRDRDEIEEVVFIVGHGENGRIGEAARRSDGRKRAAINTVDRIAEKTLAVRLKPVIEASDLQGGVAPNEHGAPAFLERVGETTVVGVFSANEGDWQVFARVSSYADWIEQTMFREGVRPLSPR
jgi:hypothetical protein